MLSEKVLPSRKLYTILGELLYKKEPETYAKLVKLIPQSDVKPSQDIIIKDFISFCQIQSIQPEEYRGNIYKHSKTEQKSLFIAVIVVRYGLYAKHIAKFISHTLQQDRGQTCRMIKEVDVRYRHLSEFKSQVDSIVEKMREVSYGDC